MTQELEKYKIQMEAIRTVCPIITVVLQILVIIKIY